MPVAETHLHVKPALLGSVPRVAKFALLAALSAGVSTASSTFASPLRSDPQRIAPHHIVVVRPKSAVPAAVEHAVTPSAYAREVAMSISDRMVRWSPFIEEAARRFRVPVTWIRAIVMIESGGRTMLGENLPIRSSAGAMGLMQVMPQTWA